MPKLGKVALLPMILSAALAAAAGAQAASDCNIDENTTVSMSVFALMAAQQPGVAPAEAKKQLQTAIGRMFADDQKAAADNARNPIGRAYTLGRVYMMFLSQEDMPVVTTRGALGFKTNPTGLADLSVGIDSAFRVVEEKAPQCQPLISQWRQQAGWVKLVQKAMDLRQRQPDRLGRRRRAAGPSHFAERPVFASRARQRRGGAQQEHGRDQAVQGRAGRGGQGHDLRQRPPHDPLHPGQLCLGRRGGGHGEEEPGNVFRRGPGRVRSPAEGSGDAVRRRGGPGSHLQCSSQRATPTRSGLPARIRLANPAAFGFLPLVRCGTRSRRLKD